MNLAGLFDYFQRGAVFLLARDGVQYPRIFPIHSRIKPFYSRHFTFITQEITNTLLKTFEGPYTVLYSDFQLSGPRVVPLLQWGMSFTRPQVERRFDPRTPSTDVPLNGDVSRKNMEPFHILRHSYTINHCPLDGNSLGIKNCLAILRGQMGHRVAG